MFSKEGKQGYEITMHCVCVRALHFQLWTSPPIFMKLGMEVMPLEVIPPLYFLKPYNR
jgi:hypothetical protein